MDEERGSSARAPRQRFETVIEIERKGGGSRMAHPRRLLWAPGDGAGG